MKKSALTLFAISIFIISCSSEETPKGEVFATDGVAISGYDPVAYFEQAEAKLGTEQSSAEYNGLTYYFSSSKNQILFQENPEQYLPDYGGWCAYAIAEGSKKMAPDPTMWQIQDGKLQLFYDDWMTSLTGGLKEEWNADPETYQRKADQNWQKIK